VQNRVSDQKGRRKRAANRETHAFPQPRQHRPIYAIFLSGRVCYFLRIRIVKAAEKVCRKLVWKSCAKHVEKALIFCGFALESLCKILWITCGEAVE
jgi:hypothetical protein